MISNESKQILSNIKNSPYGKALQDYLDGEYDIINNIQTCENWDDVMGRKRTLATLEKLFSFMSTDKVVDKQKNQYY